MNVLYSLTHTNLLLLLLLGVLGFSEAQCPNGSNTIFDNRDRMVNVPLTVPLCIGCRFLDSQGERINFNDGVWEKDPSDGGPDVTLTNGSFNGNVTILHNSATRTSLLVLTYPEAVVNFGDVLRCSSAQARPINDRMGQIIFTLLVFTFREPYVSPNGTVDVIEGSSFTLTCSDPGNSGTTRYQWINGSNGDEIGNPNNGPTLPLSLNNVQRSSSGVYICRSTNYDLPQDPLETSVTVNVQYLPDITFISSGDTLANGSNIIINCTFDANPFVHSVIWTRNGSQLHASSYSHIDINTQSTYSELIFSPFQGLDDSGDYVCNVTNSIGSRESLVVPLIVQVNPDPVINLMAPISDITTTSVRLVWSLGFNGNAPLTGGSATYTATDNGAGNGVQPFTGETVTEQMISSLEPFTTYSFSVIVTNTVGNSVQRTVSATTLPLVPTAPTLNSVTAINSTSLSVSWTDNRDPLTQSTVDNYTVVYYIEGQEQQSSQTVTVTAPSTSVSIGGLAKGTSYTVRLTATNSAGVSTDSNSVTRQTDIDPPSPVTNLFLKPYPDSICISWNPPIDNGGQDISGYRIYIRNLNSTLPDSYRLVASPSADIFSELLDQLSNFTSYGIIIAAVNPTGGHGENTSEVESTGDPFAVDANINITVTNITALSSQVNWNFPGQNQVLRLQYRASGMKWSRDREVHFSSSATGHRLNQLTPETSYDIRLITLSVGGCSQRVSRTVNFTTSKLRVVITGNTTYTAGADVILVCNLDTGGAPPGSITWMFNGGPLPASASVSDNTMTLTNSNEDDSGNYTCSFRDAMYTFSVAITASPTTQSVDPYAIVGIMAGCIVFLILTVLLLMYCLLRAKTKKNQRTSQQCTSVPQMENKQPVEVQMIPYQNINDDGTAKIKATAAGPVMEECPAYALHSPIHSANPTYEELDALQDHSHTGFVTNKLPVMQECPAYVPTTSESITPTYEEL